MRKMHAPSKSAQMAWLRVDRALEKIDELCYGVNTALRDGGNNDDKDSPQYG